MRGDLVAQDNDYFLLKEPYGRATRKKQISPFGRLVIFSFIFFMLGVYTGLNISVGAKAKKAQSTSDEFSNHAEETVALDSNYEIPKHPNDSIKFPTREERARRHAAAIKYLNSRGIQLQHSAPYVTPLSASDRKAAEAIYNSRISDEVDITITRD